MNLKDVFFNELSSMTDIQLEISNSSVKRIE